MRRALAPSLVSAVSDFVAAGLGLHFPEGRWADLERGVASAARDLGHKDAETCARWLLSAPLTRTQTEVLASHLTIGETYFFRENETLQVFERQIVPDLLRSRLDGERRIRIWSAGCCTGEEPYSIAMLLDSLIPDTGGWNVTILATDINPQFLRKAAEGVYGEWSFRGTPATIRERYFHKTRDGRFELDPRIRHRVSFNYLNLASDVYPSLLNNTTAMDVIFCRNVLMYFAEERTRRVVRGFHRSLVSGGWLIVSGVETSSSLFSSFSAVQTSGVVVYRKLPGGERQPAAMGRLTSSLVVPDPCPDQAPSARPEPVVTEPLPVSLRSDDDSASDDSGAHSTRARQCADEGRLSEAVEWCERAIEADKLNPVHHFLLAVVRQEQGHARAAAQSLMRSIYLDPSFALAHFSLGNVELSVGRRREARRHFVNALEMLGTHPDGEFLPESEGLTAGRLAEIITSVLASLPPSGDETASRRKRT